MISESSPLSAPFFLAGPTGVGKSTVALHLARILNGEIISVDSMQVYRGMDIGTAKPTASERAEIPHHLLDVVGLEKTFDAATFVDLAKEAEKEIRDRGRIPVFCGGTGLYFQAYLRGLGAAPAPDPALRDTLERAPLEDLLTELEREDPVLYSRIDRANRRRIVRAIEVIRLTGKAFSSQRSAWHVPEETTCSSTASAPFFVALERDRNDLRLRIEARVDAMFRLGLVDEVKRLLEEGLAQNRTALQALGYRQVVEHLQGNLSLPATIEAVKVKTWQFARRQMTWFRRQTTPVWVRISNRETLEAVAITLRDKYLRHQGRLT